MAQTFPLRNRVTNPSLRSRDEHRARLLHENEAVMSATYTVIQESFLNLFQRIILGELTATILKQANPINNQRE